MARNCICCGESYKKFPNERSRREFQELSGICACCWEITMLEPDADEEKIEHAKKVLLFYNRKFIMSSELPHSWQCLKCEQNVQGEQIQSPHKCEVKRICKLCTKSPESGGGICQKCKSIFYCSKICQKDDWPRHKKEDCVN
ncbi:11523_t:CDS:1 [Funneliformis caledonium]|uniref:11523_t:CDS:1 n=2 Tax=Funneliformis TaxID=1117308 RepID=A0A9N9CPA6_9GLOM|nr:11523_t:CDS:1 [Funneliformis caledonium]CAG8681263.1 5898_t:CDS:1 [Funneliformis mosseae]